jgi:GT2 family glycosyltransferase
MSTPGSRSSREAHVVIATFDRCAILERTLSALSRQSVDGFHVHVVDDGSTDGTDELLRGFGNRRLRFELKTLRQTNSGQGQARNRALREIAEGLVLFLGDDVIPGPTWLAEHLAAHTPERGPCAVVGFIDWRRSEMKVTPALEMVNQEGHQFGFAHMEPGREVGFNCFYTSNLSIDRELLGDDPFDPNFRLYGWEDIELGYRLNKRGIKLYYEPAARAEHLHPMTLGDLYRRQSQVGRAFHTLIRLHPELAGDPRFTPPVVPGWYRATRLFVPPLLGLLSALDGRGVPLSRGVLHRVLMSGYYSGYLEDPGDPT